MEIGKTFRPRSKKDVRNWFIKNHENEKEIWFVFYTKDSKIPFVPYVEVLDEALCFGWIDSIVKKLDKNSRAQRFTPRKPKSPVSELNKEKMRRLFKSGLMTPSGLAVAPNLNNIFKIPKDILVELKKDKKTWNNFQKFPNSYQRVRTSWIEGARSRPEVFKQRLEYFLKMTKKNKKFGNS